MKLLITGGAGFMGSNFIKHILKCYPRYRIVNLDKLTYAGNMDNLRGIADHPRHTFIKGDIANPKLIEKIVGTGCDAIVNYAAETHVDRSIRDSKMFLETEIFGTYTLLEGVKKYKVKRFIQISTDEVYGQIERGKFTENSALQPRNPYAAAKAGADLLCEAYAHTHGIPVIITRSCNFYGPHHYPEKFIPLAITNLLEGKKILVYGTGQERREWIYAHDHCRAIDLILHSGVRGETYNISSGVEIANIDTAKRIARFLHKSESCIEFIKNRSGHDFRYALSSKKIEKLGFKPLYTFDQGLKETIAWFQQNEWWWKKIKHSSAFTTYYKNQYAQ